MTIAKELNLKDPEGHLGARMLRQAAERTDEIVGDGTSTSTIPRRKYRYNATDRAIIGRPRPARHASGGERFERALNGLMSAIGRDEAELRRHYSSEDPL